jgi:hypothetical protein
MLKIAGREVGNVHACPASSSRSRKWRALDDDAKEAKPWR